MAIWLTYGYFLICFIIGWLAAGLLNFESIMRNSPSRAGKFFLRLGISLVFAEGFRIFLSYVIGPFLDALVNQSVNGFKSF